MKWPIIEEWHLRTVQRKLISPGFHTDKHLTRDCFVVNADLRSIDVAVKWSKTNQTGGRVMRFKLSALRHWLICLRVRSKTTATMIMMQLYFSPSY